AKAAVLAAVIEQRFARAVASLFDEPDENRVVPFNVPRHRPALELRERAVEERHAVLAERVRHAVELVHAGGREASRHVLVHVTQKVDGEACAVTQRRITLRLVVDAYEDLWRIE